MVGQATVEFKIAGVQEQLVDTQQWLLRAASEGAAAHEVERHLFRTMMALGHRLLEGFLKLMGPGDLGQTTSLEDGRMVTAPLEDMAPFLSREELRENLLIPMEEA